MNNSMKSYFNNILLHYECKIILVFIKQNRKLARLILERIVESSSQEDSSASSMKKFETDVVKTFTMKKFEIDIVKTFTHM